MIVYLQTKSQFREDILSNRIDDKVLESFKGAFGRKWVIANSPHGGIPFPT